MTRLTLFLFLILSVNLIAQPAMDDGIPMQYSMILKQSDELTDPATDQCGLNWGGAFTPDRFYPPEMKKLLKAFEGKLEHGGLVKNHLGPLGAPTPMSLATMRADEALEAQDNVEWKSFGSGNYLINLGNYSAKYLYKEGAVYEGQDTFLFDGKIYAGVDTVYAQDLQTGEMMMNPVQRKIDLAEDFAGMTFTETWKYDDKKGSFEKGIHLLSLNVIVYDALTGEFRGLREEMNFESGKFRGKYEGVDGLVKEDIESVVLFSRGLFEDCNTDCSSANVLSDPDAAYFMETSQRVGLITDLMRGVTESKLQVVKFDPVNFKLKEAQKVDVKTYFSSMTTRDTVYTENLETGEMEQHIVSIDKMMSEVIGISFFEDWYVDEETLGFKKKVKGILLLTPYYDGTTGEVIGIKPFTNHVILLNN